MIRADENLQFVVPPMLRLQLRMMELSLYQANIQFEIGDRFSDGRGIGNLQGYIGLRIMPSKLGNHGHREIITYSQRGAQLQPAHDALTPQRLFKFASLS